eukprot:835321_1
MGRAEYGNLEAMLVDLKEIQVACLGKEKEDDYKKGLDAYQLAKFELFENLGQVKEDLDVIEREPGRDPTVVRLRLAMIRKFEFLRVFENDMEVALAKDEIKVKKKKKKAISQDELETRREVSKMLKRDLAAAYARYEKVQGSGDTKGKGETYSAARDAVDTRKKARAERRRRIRNRALGLEEGKEEDEEIAERPLNDAEQLFIQESLQKDQELAAHLKDIHSGLKVLQQKAEVMHTELETQAVLMEEVGEKVDLALEQMETTSRA